MRDMRTRIVIAGGGFAGVYVAMYLDKNLSRSRDVEVVPRIRHRRLDRATRRIPPAEDTGPGSRRAAPRPSRRETAAA